MEISKTIKTPRSTFTLVLALMVFAIAWRLTPHVANFAPLAALALLGGSALRGRHATLLVFGALAISDILIGTYSGIEWTWLSYGLIIALGMALKPAPLQLRIGIGALAASVLFFLVSNFGTWMASGMYTRDISGLIECYVYALPFFHATLLSNIVFGALFLGAHALTQASSHYVARRFLSES